MLVKTQKKIVCCSDNMTHPKVYLKIAENGEVKCPYCYVTYQYQKE